MDWLWLATFLVCIAEPGVAEPGVQTVHESEKADLAIQTS